MNAAFRETDRGCPECDRLREIVKEREDEIQALVESMSATSAEPSSSTKRGNAQETGKPTTGRGEGSS